MVRIFILAMVLATTAHAQNVIMCPDGTYVVGTRCILTPDGTYVGGN